MLLRGNGSVDGMKNFYKSLSGILRNTHRRHFHRPGKCRSAKVLQCVCLSGSFTVEAAFVVPLFLFAALAVLGLFSLLKVEMKVNEALQYTARTMAVSFHDTGEPDARITFGECQVIFRTYYAGHGGVPEDIQGGMAGISLLRSEWSGDYVELIADYRVKLPISFWRIRVLPVEQCVRAKKWNGASAGEEGEANVYVYITPKGNAYHSTPSCSYLALSIRNVPLIQAQNMRSRDGSIYYACSCYHGGDSVYVTDYGNRYHGSLTCGGLKRTIYQVTRDQVEHRHACSKCVSGS